MADIQFWRSKQMSDSSFLDLVRREFGKVFTKGIDAKNWLIANGYYTNYPDIVTDGLVLYLDAANSDSFKGEPTTNLLTYSEDFITNWGKGGTYGLTGNTYSPIDNKSGTLLYTNTASNIMKSITVTSGLAYTLSWFVKKFNSTSVTCETNGTNSVTLSFNFDTLSLGGSASNKTYVDEGNGWYRLSFTITASSTGSLNFFLYGGNGYDASGTSYIWGAQIEQKNYATNYIRSTSTNGVRGTTYATGGGWRDLSGNGNHGTLINGPTYNSSNLGSIVFDGIDDRISTGNINLSSTNKITISFFCKILSYTEVSNNGKIIFEITSNFNNSSVGLCIGYSDDSHSMFNKTYPISLNLKGNIGYNISGFDKNLVNDLKWHHWVCIFDKSVTGTSPQETILYIDGVYRNPTIIPTSTYRSDNTNNFGNEALHIGQRAGNISLSNIQLSNLQIYNRRLTDEEILKIFNDTKNRFGL